MLRSLFFSALLTLSTTALAQLSIPPKVIDQWSQTQISFENLLYGSINDESCLKTEANFLGCLNALNKSVSMKDSKYTYLLLPDEASEDPLPGFSAQKLDRSSESYKKDKENYQKRVFSLYKELKAAGSLKRPTHFRTAILRLESEYKGKKEEAFMTGMLYNSYLSGAYDPHTYVAPKARLKEMSRSTQVNQRYGFGYKVVEFEGAQKLIIQDVETPSPAFASGLTRGDVFLSINGKSTAEEMALELNNNSVVADIIGPSGTRTLTLHRGEVESSLTNFYVATNHNGRKYFVIKLDAFAEGVCRPIIEKGLLVKADKSFKGIIFDVRNNPGGNVNEVKCISSLFLERFSYIWVDKKLDKKRFESEKVFFPNKIFNDFHTVVLVNGASASASEALSLFLQAYRKAFVLGEETFGKGTMQSVAQDPQFSSLVRAQTVAKYYGPHGISPQIQGVTPDFKVYPNFGQTEPTAFNRERDLYENAIINEPEEVPVMKERTEQIAKINDCLHSTQVVEKDYEQQDRFEKLIFDQQLAAAVGVLDCALDLKIPVYKSSRIPSKL